MENINFYDLSYDLIRLWISEKNIIFATNSTCNVGGLLLSSLNTYINYIPNQNFILIPGNNYNYGLKAFILMLNISLLHKHIDYIIYIDEDCFISNFKGLMNEFYNFYINDYSLGGILDGGVICHRNHSSLLINTFISFWNIKLLKLNNISFELIMNDIRNNINNKNIYYEFINTEKFINDNLKNKIKKYVKDSLNINLNIRNKYFNNTNPYSIFILNDTTNLVEPHQLPYTYDDYKIKYNFEPYYIILLIILKYTKFPIYYLKCTDLYFNNEYLEKYNLNENVDNGLTSMILDNNNIIALHTWFSRFYNKWVNNNIQYKHSLRINNVIKFNNYLIKNNK